MRKAHFLITRFNLYNPIWTRNKKGEVINSQKWLEDRFEIFIKYCLPSVVNQSNQNFKWLIYFDTRTPDLFREKIINTLSNYNIINFFFIDGFKNFDNELKKYIHNNTYTQNILITTRLDNDDLIHKLFIEEIHSAANNIKKKLFLVTCSKGLTLQLIPFAKITRFYYLYNPFISLVETIDNSNTIKTVFFYGHEDLIKTGIPLFETKKNWLWMQYIHDNNIANFSQGKSCLLYLGFGSFQQPFLNLNIKIAKAFIATSIYNIKNFLKLPKS